MRQKGDAVKRNESTERQREKRENREKYRETSVTTDAASREADKDDIFQ